MKHSLKKFKLKSNFFLTINFGLKIKASISALPAVKTFHPQSIQHFPSLLSFRVDTAKHYRFHNSFSLDDGALSCAATDFNLIFRINSIKASTETFYRLALFAFRAAEMDNDMGVYAIEITIKLMHFAFCIFYPAI